MRIKRITLQMRHCLHIQTETRTDERPPGSRIRISRQHPTFVLMIAKDIHQPVQAELDIGVPEIQQFLGSIFR
jgi:hypothetical protein